MRVLLIEDDANTAQSIELMLKTEGHNCDTVGLGQNGLEFGKLNDYDIIILDFMLPDIDGAEVARRLREAHVNAPILIQSGLANCGDNLTAKGVDDAEYLMKPFNRSELNSRIQDILRRARSQARTLESTRQSAGERRSQPRVRTLKAAEINSRGIEEPIECTILDLSLDGARIETAEISSLPVRLKLSSESDDARHCEIVWTRGNKLGVQFVD